MDIIGKTAGDAQDYLIRFGLSPAEASDVVFTNTLIKGARVSKHLEAVSRSIELAVDFSVSCKIRTLNPFTVTGGI
jgi:hypothetical protein